MISITVIRNNQNSILTNHRGMGSSSRSLPTETTCECKILGLDGNTLGVDSGQVGVLKERDKVCLSGFLQGHDSRGLEAEIGLGEKGE